jgi:maltose alpha-D-glucosyltransferase/alpha-amylase
MPRGKSQSMKSRLEDTPAWYKDAVVYELHVKAFFDSNGDGVGDLKGLIRRLDYLHELGITAIWLLPFYPSPLRDDGYDIADYRDIHEAYGSLQDFKELLRQAHSRGIRIITEVVLNHTSDQHPWFQRSRRAKPGSSWRKFYVWSRTPNRYSDARIIFTDFESSNWTWDAVAGAYYWHRFYSHQPDLNFDHPGVQNAIFRIIDFWLEMGVDGLRLDAVPYLWESEGTNCENLPETHSFLKKLRAHVDRKFTNRMLLAEANQWPEDAAAYFGDGDECHMAFNFPLMPRLFMALRMEDRFPIVDIMEPSTGIPEICQWAMFLRNHDELTLEMVTDEERDYMYRAYADDPRSRLNIGIRRRLAPLLGNNRKKIELLNILLFSLPGTPVLYYGDEIGMGDNYYLGDRAGVRTPMQWSADRNAGFSRANPQRLYLPVVIDPEYHFETVNVETQGANPSSLLNWMRQVIAMRKRLKALSRGDIEFLSPRNHRVLAFLRRNQEQTILVVTNLSRFSQAVELDLSDYEGLVPKEVFSLNEFPPVKREPYVLTLTPHGYFWLSMERAPEALRIEADEEAPHVGSGETLDDLLEPRSREHLERNILAPYLKGARWFGGKAKKVRNVAIKECGGLEKKGVNGFMMLVQVEYSDGPTETYLLPLLFAAGEGAVLVEQKYPEAVIASAEIAGERGILYDGTCSRQVHLLLLELVGKRKKLNMPRGEIRGRRGRKFGSVMGERQFPLESSLMGTEHTNTLVNYQNTIILKLFRRLDSGKNPDAEVVEFLTEKARGAPVPPFAGRIEYHAERPEPVDLGFMQAYVENGGSAWDFFLDNLRHCLDRAGSESIEGVQGLDPKASIYQPLREDEMGQAERLLGGFFLQMVARLGERTGDLHMALASSADEPAFKPEPFTQHYQRSMYQSIRGIMRQALRLLRGNLNDIAEDAKPYARALLASEKDIEARLGEIVRRRITARKIRIHGDYHLGQVLYTGKDFVVIDFEGEPARPLGERRLKRSPLRDVATMLRSLHYAGRAGLLRYRQARSGGTEALEGLTDGWYRVAARAFLHSYLEAAAGGGFLPRTGADMKILLEVLLLEKALYELGHELNNRPDWVIIPLIGIAHTMEDHARE